MGRVIHAGYRFRVPYNLARGEPEYWVCIDERLALLKGFQKTHITFAQRRLTLINHQYPRARYHSTAGGAVGLGQDMDIAVRLSGAKNLSSKNTVDLRHLRAIGRERAKTSGEAPKNSFHCAHILGSVGVKAARNIGINILNHEGCAAETNTPVIARGIANNKGPNGENVYEVIKDHWNKDGKRATLPEVRFRQIQETFAAALEEGTIVQPEISGPVYDDGGTTEDGSELLPTPRVPLLGMDHYADTHLIEWQPDTIYDREAALNASNFEDNGVAYGAYQTSMGSAGNLHEAIADVIPIGSRDFSDAMFVRNAATSLYLPRQYGEQTPTQLQGVA